MGLSLRVENADVECVVASYRGVHRMRKLLLQTTIGFLEMQLAVLFALTRVPKADLLGMRSIEDSSDDERRGVTQISFPDQCGRVRLRRLSGQSKSSLAVRENENEHKRLRLYFYDTMAAKTSATLIDEVCGAWSHVPRVLAAMIVAYSGILPGPALCEFELCVEYSIRHNLEGTLWTDMAALEANCPMAVKLVPQTAPVGDNDGSHDELGGAVDIHPNDVRWRWMALAAVVRRLDRCFTNEWFMAPGGVDYVKLESAMSTIEPWALFEAVGVAGLFDWCCHSDSNGSWSAFQSRRISEWLTLILPHLRTGNTVEGSEEELCSLRVRTREIRDLFTTAANLGSPVHAC